MEVRKVSKTSIMIEIFKPINSIMLKGGWIFAKIYCIKRKELLHRPKTLEFVTGNGSRKSQRGWRKNGTIIRQPSPVPRDFSPRVLTTPDSSTKMLTRESLWLKYIRKLILCKIGNSLCDCAQKCLCK